MQQRLIEHVLVTAITAVGATHVTLWGAPDTAHGFFMRCRQRYGIRLARQAAGDLGARMRSTLRRAPGLLIGSDALGLTAADLCRAAVALRTSDYLLQPALDGGYVLIGARKPLPTLAGIVWSSGREGRQTATRLARSGTLRWLTPARNDLDTPSDWRHARRQGQLMPLIHRQKKVFAAQSQLAGLPFTAEAC